MRLQPIDTLRVADTLRESGVPDEQARAHAAVLADSLQAHDAEIDAQMCKKSDLQEAVTKLDAKIETSIAKLGTKLITWTVSVGFLQSALIVTLMVNLIG